MKNALKFFFVSLNILFSINTVFSQLKVENDGSLYVNSYQGEFGRANWTQVHYQYTCAYHLANSYYNDDVFYVRGDGYVWTRHGFLIASDSVYKTNIENIPSSLETIMNLRGVSYNRKYTVDSIVTQENTTPNSANLIKIKETKLEPREYGLIAQEVENVVPEVVVLMPDSTKAVSYSSLIPLLIEAVKEQQKQIESLLSIVNDQEKRLENCYDYCIEAKKPKFSDATVSISDDGSFYSENILYQNTPNPFNKNTQINYYLSEKTKNAVINIYNMNGNQLKSVELHQTGYGYITINACEFDPGIYLYVLITDERPIDSKQMILTD